MADPLALLTEKAVRDVAAATSAAIQREAPPYVRPSIAVTVTGSGRAAVATVKARGLSPIVLAGQRAHTIEPRDSTALSWSGGDHPVGRVSHPMVPANDFVTRGLRAAHAPVTKTLEAAGHAMGDVVAAAVAERLAD